MILINKPLIISALREFGQLDGILADLELQDAVDEEFDDGEIEEMLDALIEYHKSSSITTRLKEAVEETVFQFDPDTAKEMMVSRICAENGYGWYSK